MSAHKKIKHMIEAKMAETTITHEPNNFYIEVSGSGLPEVDGLFIPSMAPPAVSESGTMSRTGYWNGKPAWDRADDACSRSPSLSYSNGFKSWRISRLDGHLAYFCDGEDELPPTDRDWEVYKMGVAPAPKITIYRGDPRLPCPPPHVFFILGGPGAGKGTMCELAKEQLGWVHLSMGDLLRAEHQAGGALAADIQKTMNRGRLVSDEILMELLHSAMERITRTTGKRNFLLDGFPRSKSNLKSWIRAFGREMELPTMLYFECPFEELKKRILGRAKYSGRVDDNVESMKLRFDTFRAETLPVVELFKKHGKCVEIDTSPDRRAVFEIVRKHLAEFTEPDLAARPLTERAEIILGLRPYESQTVTHH